MSFDIRERAKKFAIRIIRIIKRFPNDVSGYEIGRQLLRSGTSIGANLEEADGASTRKDFFHKTSISYKETKETRYWLEIVLGSDLLMNQSEINEAKLLQVEAVELSKILYSIINPKKTSSKKEVL